MGDFEGVCAAGSLRPEGAEGIVQGLEDVYAIEAVSAPSRVTHVTFTRKVAT